MTGDSDLCIGEEIHRSFVSADELGRGGGIRSRNDDAGDVGRARWNSG